MFIRRIFNPFLILPEFITEFGYNCFKNSESLEKRLLGLKNKDVYFLILRPSEENFDIYIIFNIENIIINANKKYKITNEKIFNELKIECPNEKDSISDEILSTIDRYGSIHSLSTVNNNDINICYYN